MVLAMYPMEWRSKMYELYEKLPNKSTIIITIQTSFKPQISEGEDFRDEIIKRFHTAVFEVVEKFLIENEDLEQDIMEELQKDWLPETTKEFPDLGEIAISISQDKCVVGQENLSDENVAFHLAKLKKPNLPKEQKRLSEMTL